MEKTVERKAFEYLYQSKKNQANPDGLSHEYEEGIMKGITDMAFLAGVITDEELSQCYKEISEIYCPIKRLNKAMEEFKKAE